MPVKRERHTRDGYGRAAPLRTQIDAGAPAPLQRNIRACGEAYTDGGAIFTYNSGKTRHRAGSRLQSVKGLAMISAADMHGALGKGEREARQLNGSGSARTAAAGLFVSGRGRGRVSRVLYSQFTCRSRPAGSCADGPTRPGGGANCVCGWYCGVPAGAPGAAGWPVGGGVGSLPRRRERMRRRRPVRKKLRRG